MVHFSKPLPACSRRLLLLLFIGSPLAEPAQAGHHAPLETAIPLSLNEALKLALGGNPGLHEIRARAEAAAAMPSQAGALPDPELSFGALNIPSNTFNLHQDDMTMMAVGLSQQIPFPGKLDLLEQAATLESEVAAKTVDEARIRLARDVKLGWWSLFYFDRVLAVLYEAQTSFQELVNVALAQYRAGGGSQQDVLLAQLEWSKLEDRNLEIINMRHGEAARFNALLNRPSNMAIVIPKTAELLSPARHEDAVLFEIAGQTQPRIIQKRIAIDAAKARLAYADKDYWPDLNIGAGYAFRQSAPDGRYRSDFAELRLSINLPIYAAQKQSKAVDQRNSELLKEQFALADELRRLEAEITETLAGYHHASERVQLLQNDILPQAKRTVQSLLVGYRNGQNDMNSLLRAEISVFDDEIQYWSALAQSQQSLAKLAAAIGEVSADEK